MIIEKKSDKNAMNTYKGHLHLQPNTPKEDKPGQDRDFSVMFARQLRKTAKDAKPETFQAGVWFL